VQNTLVTRPTPTVLRFEYGACRLSDIGFDGVVESERATPMAGGTWAGTVRMMAFSSTGTGSNLRAQTVSVVATGSGTVDGLTLQLTGLSARRAPSALGLNTTLTRPLLRVERVMLHGEPVTRQQSALEGCLSFTATDLNAELCRRRQSRLGLLENLGSEQLTGRLRWNAATPGGFDNKGSFEASAALDRGTEIGLRL
jgi:hypothetical protein